jgi:hypothetical protein
MQGISDIKITGIDETRPPVIRKEPYIDLFFKLSHQAPANWCKDFNSLLVQHPSSPKIKELDGRYIECWVRTPDEIVTLFILLKETVADCTRQYIERIDEAARDACNGSKASSEDSGEQGRLNRIISSLDFDKDVKL